MPGVYQYPESGKNEPLESVSRFVIELEPLTATEIITLEDLSTKVCLVPTGKDKVDKQKFIFGLKLKAKMFNSYIR